MLHNPPGKKRKRKVFLPPMDPLSTPDRRPQVQPDTAPKRMRSPSPPSPLGEEGGSPGGKKKTGRPPSRKKKRPQLLAEFRGAGAPTPEAWGAIRMHNALCPEMSIRDASAMFGVAPSTLHRTLKERKLGDATMSKQNGPPKKDNCERNQLIDNHLDAFPHASLSEISSATGVPRSTVAWVLEQTGRKAYARPTIPWTGGDMEAWKLTRLNFCKDFLKRLPKRSAILFVDESLFRVSDTRKWQWVKEGQEVDPREVHGWGAGAHVWGCIGVGFRVLIDLTGKGTGPKGGITAEDYARILTAEFLPALRRHQARHPNVTYLFVQDGARVHMSHDVLGTLGEWGLAHFVRRPTKASGELVAAGDVWPPHSPDLNPIENLWAILKMEVNDACCGDLSNTKENRDHLWATVQRTWREIAADVIDRLVDSWPRRLKNCVAARGGHSGY